MVSKVYLFLLFTVNMSKYVIDRTLLCVLCLQTAVKAVTCFVLQNSFMQGFLLQIFIYSITGKLYLCIIDI